MSDTRTLYLIRHAIAAERGDAWPDDARRPLTHAGAARMRQITKGLWELGVTIDLIVTSPLTRAAETAEIVGRGFKTRPEIIAMPALAPGGAPARVAEALAPHTSPRAFAIVGHEPELGELAGWLIGSRTPLAFKKGGVACIEVSEWPPARKGQLLWLATPRMLRSLR